MNAPATATPVDSHRHALAAIFDALAERLERYAHDPEALRRGPQPVPPWPEALDTLRRRFDLSPFEAHVIALCAGLELDSRFTRLCAAALDGQGHDGASAGLALAALPEPHWSAFAPQAPLRRWHLMEMSCDVALIRAAIRLDERVLNYLLGIDARDRRLAGLLHPLTAPRVLPATHRVHVDALRDLWHHHPVTPPVACIDTGHPRSARAVAAEACVRMGWQPLLLREGDLPSAPGERALLARLLERECALVPAAIVLDAGTGDGRDPAPWVDELACPVVLIGRAPACERRRVLLAIDPPAPPERRALWQANLGALLPEPELETLADQFWLDGAQIADVAASVAAMGHGEPPPGGPSVARIRQLCRHGARAELAGLAERIESTLDWSDLVLPESQRVLLEDMVRQMRHRTQVYERWGHAARSRRGLGLSALFAGESGTGKTLAAEVLANELGLDLYRVDLSAVVSKYIGETEKNLERVFRGAEASGAVLLFDEADALFGKRSDVKDSHDRYANIELAFLLQRMEAYRGLAILTTNLKSVVDPAFLRRIRFVVQFPFPDLAQRRAIWMRMFPDAQPREDLCFDRLARLSVAGGNIRNIALNAAFLAAEAGRPLGMVHLVRAARMECAKIERPVSDTELGGWA